MVIRNTGCVGVGWVQMPQDRP